MTETAIHRSFATIILAGGKGTRMGSAEKHKVCFEVLGVPVIIRALETYNLCGSSLNVVVVGALSESVMSTVSRRFSGVAYAYQDTPLGTGDAARRGAAVLERARFEGDILVVAGDKVITPAVIQSLIATHRQARADVTVATARRPPGSSTGIMLTTRQGRIVGILEEAERQRLLALSGLSKAVEDGGEVAWDQVREIVSQSCSPRTAERVLRELSGDAMAPPALRRTNLKPRFNPDERNGQLRVAGEPIPAEQILERFGQMNLSTYLFRAPVLYDVLHRLKSMRSSQEEYLTDVFGLLAAMVPPATVVGSEVADTDELMAFNNPQELLAIETAYRRRLQTSEAADPVGSSGRPTLDSETRVESPWSAPVPVWAGLAADPTPAFARQLKGIYGGDVPWPKFHAVLDTFGQRYGTDRQVSVVRSPGRINLMGRHIDHQGGAVNVMAIDREILLVAAAREDDLVTLCNADAPHFGEQRFRISDLVANLNWDDWQHVVDGPRIQRILESARGDWANYVKAAILRLQEQFRDRQLRGLDLMISGDIPMGAGLSSSSALVVATAEAVRLVNHLPVSARRLVSLCGEGEWFVGTRGGAADHAAIRLSRRGCVTRVGFFPFSLQGSARFLPGHDLVVCNSGVYAGKSAEAKDTFNAKVTSYHLGRVWFKMLRPDLAPRIAHLRDINSKNLGLTRSELWALLQQLPARLSRSKAQSVLAQAPTPERDALERLFASHQAPVGGYEVRGVALFGLSEIERAQKCLDLLKAGDASELGRLMRVSHDGDRVSKRGRRDGRTSAARTAPPVGVPTDLAEVPGAYGCSLPAIDRIVDVALTLPGVQGAQLAGAGLGGCVMVLVQEAHSSEVVQSLTGQGIHAQVFRPIAGAGALRL